MQPILRRAIVCILLSGLSRIPAQAAEITYQPSAPTFEDVITIEVHGCSQGGTLHWGVNASDHQWQKAIPEYRPPGSTEMGVATRTRLMGPDTGGICRVVLGPFDNTNQPVGSVDYVIQWNDGTWDNAAGLDYHIPISFARITIKPVNPGLNDKIMVTVHRGASGGQLRWGVNADYEGWKQPATNYWPDGSVPSDDGMAVDSPLPPPDAFGRSTLALGPFNRPEQVVTGFHAAVHWGNVWDANLGRNYNQGISLDGGAGAPVVTILSPLNDQVVISNLAVQAQWDQADSVELLLDGQPAGSATSSPAAWDLPVDRLDYGQHVLTVRATRNNIPGIRQAFVWKVNADREAPLPPNTTFGATEHQDGTVTFALFAPKKHLISLVGDFNGWNPQANPMKLAPDGTWWLTLPFTPGTYSYQYCIDRSKFLADPYSTAVTWKNPQGEESHFSKDAKSILRVGAPAFTWQDQSFIRPPLDNLLIYEFYIEDLCPGQGFTGVVAKLDYIKDLGVSAIEPLPLYEFPGGFSWGYNPAFHMAAERAYGTPDDLKTMIDEAHRRGLAVIIDMVLNHMEPNGPLYQLYGPDFDSSPYFHLYTGENWGFPDIKQESESLKKYVADVLRFWLTEYHADGFRYDATRWVGWQGYNDWGASWFAYAAKQVVSNSYQIAEHLPTDPDLMNKTPMDASWFDYFRWGIRNMIRNAQLNRWDFERIMEAGKLGFGNPFQRVAYIESHDEDRFLRELEQSGYSSEDALRRDLTAVALTLTAPAVAMVYSGEEFGETTPKIVGPNALHWTNLDQPPIRALHDQFRTLAHLRTSHPALRSPEFRLQTNSLPENVIVYDRTYSNACVVVAVNFGRNEQTAALTYPIAGTWTNVLGGESLTLEAPTTRDVKLAPGAVSVMATAQ